MKRILLFLSLFILLSLACDMSVAVGPTSNPAPIATNTSAPTTVPSTQVPASPIPATTTASQPVFAGEAVSFGPLSIALSPELAGGAHGIQMPRAEGESADPWGVTPGHIQLILESYLLQGKQYEPQVFVYPAQSYAEMYPPGFESMHRLNNILDNGGAPIPPDQLPAVPFFNAAQVFASNIRQVSFQNGKGVRFLTEYAQYPASANNEDLFYHFQGLTNDGAYYVIAILPVRHPALAETRDTEAVLPSGGIPYPSMGDPNADWPSYYGAVTSLLDTSPQDVFTPRLDQLDTLIQSIRIGDPLAPTTTPEVFNPAPVEGVISDKARSDLANRLGMDITSIRVAEFTAQGWPDDCLGLASTSGQECAKRNVPGWRIVLNAAGHTHEYRATADGNLISYSGPVTIADPESCKSPGTSFIYSPEDGYCFAYPVYFHRNNERGPIEIFGPTHGPGPEPLSASMTMEIRVLPEGQTLEQAINAFVETLGNVPLHQTRQSITVGGEPAFMLEVVPGMLGSRDVFFTHQGLLFHLTFWPAPSVAPETKADVEDLYQTVLSSWNF